MKRNHFLKHVLLVYWLFLLVFTSCTPRPTPIITPNTATPTLAPPTATAVPPTSTPVPQGRTLLVTSPADNGPGTLRQAMQDAQPYDTITFDPAIFPPDAPVTIYVTDGLPEITQGNLMIDGSDSWVILDGSNLPRDTWISGLAIVSNGNTIHGLQFVNFSGAGIVIGGNSQNNTVGGDRSIGHGPIGQGNLSSGNSDGIAIWNSASNNVVTGNLVGTDISATQPMGNHGKGVYITEQGVQNVIGPDNIIAHNGECGIQVDGSNSLGNTHTRNGVFNNGLAGICLAGGGNVELRAPVLFDFNLAGGLISGTACANCTIEIFSDESDEGAIYEGQITADDTGAFSFDRGVPFIGPHLTATVTDIDGNTSEFSLPTSGTSKTLSLQLENNLPLTLLSPKPSQELLDNHIGVHTEDYDRYSYTEQVYMNGFKWIRIQSLTEFWESNRVDLKTFTLTSIPPSVDSVISEYATNGVNIVLDLWMGAGLRPYGTTFQSTEEVKRFSDYVRFIVSHFKGRIGYYEIWNEPGDVTVSDYANLVRQVVPIIREEDPGARIIIGAIPGSWEEGYPGYGAYQRFHLHIDYLNELLLSGVAPLVDGISWHPFYDNIPSDPYYQDYPQILKGIKELAASQGFKGEYFADELLWRTKRESAPGWYGGPPVSPLVAAKYYMRAITLHRGLGTNVTISTFFQDSILSPIHNLNDALAGAEPTEIPLSITNEAANIHQYAFSLRNGNRLIVLWTNGEALEDDPGVPATLTFPGTSAQKVIGIDVLHGFEQELIIEMENGDLVIRDFLIKDYPIILRLIR